MLLAVSSWSHPLRLTQRSQRLLRLTVLLVLPLPLPLLHLKKKTKKKKTTKVLSV
jgi:hypothetical protein